MYLTANDLSQSEMYKILIGGVAPRPIAWVGTRGRDGSDNLAPFSFYNVFSAKPPIVGFAPSPHSDGRRKDTLQNVLDAKCFTLSCVSHKLVRQMSRSGALLEPDESEFEHAGLTPAEARSIVAPYVEESLLVFECILNQVVKFGTAPDAGSLILGEITHIHIDDAIYQDGRIDIGALDPVGRLAGDWYSTIRDRFELGRG